MFALTATFAPAIGPTIGGYLTENFGWQYIFYVNLVPGIAMVVILWLTLEREPMRLDLLAQGDWVGILTMAIGLTALQTVLDEGNKDDWFDSPFRRASFRSSRRHSWRCLSGSSSKVRILSSI